MHLITAHNQNHKKETEIDGFRVYFLPVHYEQAFGKWRRIWSFAKFMFSSYRLASDIKNADLVFATSTPITTGITALLLKYFRKIPFVFEVRDLWPEVPVEMKIIENKILVKLLYKLAKIIYKNAEYIVALSPGMAEVIKAYKIKTPVSIITNFTDPEIFNLTKKSDISVDNLLKESEKGIIYFGHLGRANHLEYFIEAAKECQAQNLPIKFFIVGEGSEKQRLEAFAKTKNVNNLIFLPAQPKEKLKELLVQMDFAYISFLYLPVLFTSSPNKLFDGLATGKVCITNTKGWMKNLLEENKCGLWIDPLNPQAFPDKIKPFLKDKILLQTYQENALKLSKNEFTAEIAGEKLLEIFNKVKSNLNN